MTSSTAISRYGLVLGLVFLIAFFSVLRPDIFPTLANAGSIMSDNAVLTLVALGIMVPLVVGRFDLSPGFVASLSVMLTAGLLSGPELHPILVLVIVLAVGAVIGATIGVLCGYLKVNSLIVFAGRRQRRLEPRSGRPGSSCWGPRATCSRCSTAQCWSSRSWSPASAYFGAIVATWQPPRRGSMPGPTGHPKSRADRMRA